ncbi:hypothetical protein C4K37_3269 [Pseudomonas chlororaphis subsp. piscium]|nr:hypothetical protein C4K37_3269 [Pseudomonas chlororaphis subsp. piscium]AZD55009.1 hypothetical protein C4K19_3222 [Pseudomonas chlororaphis subsp. aurantiaca]AZC44204.1 hypothetical protein C4K36_3279 [Pseudomonas chlororaphis subsp. piscium]AZC50864.1 hypothetical protein C4K35_3281 [Pseudomonas chlororaphis subsp. piscium]AZC57436.1 hypothetical protein C4K34_3271 [Pseudomonas chlororaphis subsp. piscium]
MILLARHPPWCRAGIFCQRAQCSPARWLRPAFVTSAGSRWVKCGPCKARPMAALR